MDRTLNPVKRGNKRRRSRNWNGLAALLPGRRQVPLLRA